MCGGRVSIRVDCWWWGGQGGAEGEGGVVGAGVLWVQ